MAGKGKRAHVVKSGNDWVVKFENQKATAGAASTQRAAQEFARRLVEKAPSGGEVVIHRPNG